MKIFLSYASERRAIAEPIAFSLRGRGFEVFLDKDDLPAGRSYDEQIETAIGSADLLVFLISPELVDPGRFTLTEVEFARRRWRRADGRVLPVMIAATDYAEVPPFLKSVSVLEPAGNVAAEVASAVAAMARPPAAGRIVPAAIAAGAISGAIAAFVPLPLDQIPEGSIEEITFLVHEGVYAPLSTPVLFALGMIAWLWFFERPPLARLLLAVPLGIAVGWFAAINATFALVTVNVDFGEETPDVTQLRFMVWFFGGIVGGIVGALFTWLGAALAVPRLFRLDAGLLAVIVGGAFGLLIHQAFTGGRLDTVMMWVLFAPWQAAVGASLAWSLSRIER